MAVLVSKEVGHRHISVMWVANIATGKQPHGLIIQGLPEKGAGTKGRESPPPRVSRGQDETHPGWTMGEGSSLRPAGPPGGG